MKTLTVSVALAIASLLVTTIEARYEKLNEYLIKSVPNDDVGQNMEAASNWLKEQGNAKSFLTMSPLNDLKQFTALQQVIDDTECGNAAYEIIKANAKAVDLQKFKNPQFSMRRVDKVISKIIASHTDRCQKTYQTKYASKVDQVNPTVLKQVDNIGQLVIAKDHGIMRKYFMEPDNLFNMYIKNTRSLTSFKNIGLALNKALVANSKGDPNAKYARQVPNESNGKREVHKKEIKELTRKYLIEPCKQYRAIMGPDLFVPADNDGRSRNKINESDEYYASWSYYKICGALTSDESAVLREVVSAVTEGLLDRWS